MPDASLWLVEITAHDGTEERILRFGSAGYVTKPTDSPANTIYDGRIAASGLGSFNRQLFNQGTTRGEMKVEAGDITLVNADGGLDGIIEYGFDKRSIVLKRLDSGKKSLSDAETVLKASGEALDSDSGMLNLRLRFYDRRRDVDVPIQDNKYGGTVTGTSASADGTADMKGQVKPLVFGKVYNVEGELVNPYDLIIQVNDGPVSSITAYDGGIKLTYDGNYSSLSALRNATGNPGHYVTCLSLGLWKPFGSFSGRPGFVWTADVVQGSSTADRCASGIVKAMLTKIGLTGTDNIDAASFSAFASDASQELGIYIDQEMSCLSAISKVLDSVGGWMIPDSDGVFNVGLLEAPDANDSVGTITEYDILTASANDTILFTQNPDTDGNIPAYQVVMKWGKYYHVHTDSDLAGCVTVEDEARATELKTEWREANDTDSSVLTKHPLSSILTIESLFADGDDAEDEAARRLDLYGVRRIVMRAAVRMDEADDYQLNKTVTVKFNRLGFDSGTAMKIIGREDVWSNEQVILTLWG